MVNKSNFEFANDKFLAENYDMLKNIMPKTNVQEPQKKFSILRMVSDFFLKLKLQTRTITLSESEDEIPKNPVLEANLFKLYKPQDILTGDRKSTSQIESLYSIQDFI